MIFYESLFTFDSENSNSGLQNKAIDLLIKNQIPFKIKNALSINLPEIILTYPNTPEIEKTTTLQELLLKILFRKEKFLNISASKNNIFSGIAENFSQISTTIDDYLSYNGSLKLYLSQINIKERLIELKEEENLQILNFKYLKIIIERNFNLKDFDTINVWHSKENTLSKFHYDYYENFLAVIVGKKIVLLSPYSADIIRSDIYGENTINQANVINKDKIVFGYSSKLVKIRKLFYKRELSEIKKLITNLIYVDNQEEKLLDNKHINNDNDINENSYLRSIEIKLNLLEKQIEKYSNFLKNIIGNKFIIKTDVKDEILYIPEGYWHKVKTIGSNNLAINFWWNNFNKIISLNKEIFTIKSSLYSLVQKYIKQRGKMLMDFKMENLTKFKYLVENKEEKKLNTFLFKEKFNLDKFILIYYFFENFSDNIFIDLNNDLRYNWNVLIKIFWDILRKNKKEHLFFKNFEKMRKLITRKIIKEQIL